MAYQDLRVTIADGVAELVLDRPAHRGTPYIYPSELLPLLAFLFAQRGLVRWHAMRVPVAAASGRMTIAYRLLLMGRAPS